LRRAKAIAIKRAIATQQEEGIREMDLHLAFDAEYIEKRHLSDDRHHRRLA